jgi:hypothetical protein
MRAAGVGAIVAVLAVVAAAAGCGGSSLSPDGARAKANRVCATAAARIDNLGIPADAPGVAVAAAAADDIDRQAAVALRAIDSEPDVEEQVQALAASIDHLRAALTTMAAVIPGSAAQAKAMAPAIFADLDAVDDLSARARLAGCSSESLGRAIAIAASAVVGVQQ